MAEQRHRDRAWIGLLLVATGLFLSTGLQAAQPPEAPIEILEISDVLSLGSVLEALRSRGHEVVEPS